MGKGRMAEQGDTHHPDMGDHTTQRLGRRVRPVSEAELKDLKARALACGVSPMDVDLALDKGELRALMQAAQLGETKKEPETKKGSSGEQTFGEMKAAALRMGVPK